MKKWSIFFLSLLLVAALISGCSGSQAPSRSPADMENSSGDQNNDYEYPQAETDEQPQPNPAEQQGEAGFIPDVGESVDMGELVSQMLLPVRFNKLEGLLPLPMYKVGQKRMPNTNPCGKLITRLEFPASALNNS